MLRPTRTAVRPSLALCVLTAAGCVDRTLVITSTPPGALVWVNDREVGRTPVRTAFTYYGTYDVRLVREGFEALQSEGRAVAPWWDRPIVDLVAEVMPERYESMVSWHFHLQPRDDDRGVLVERARSMRSDATEDDDGSP